MLRLRKMKWSRKARLGIFIMGIRLSRRLLLLVLLGLVIVGVAWYSIAERTTAGVPSVEHMEVATNIPPNVLTGYVVITHGNWMLQGDDGKGYYLFVLQGMQIDLAQFINKHVQVQGFLAVSSAGDAALVLNATPILI
jgi:hypothetical protein